MAALLALTVAAIGGLLTASAVLVSGQPAPTATGQLIMGGEDTPFTSSGENNAFGLFGHQAPSASATGGCAVIPSQYLNDGPSYLHYYVNVANSACVLGVVITYTESVLGTPGSSITQNVLHSTLGAATSAPFLLP